MGILPTALDSTTTSPSVAHRLPPQQRQHLALAVADLAKGLRAGHAQALPAVPCKGDVFHAH